MNTVLVCVYAVETFCVVYVQIGTAEAGDTLARIANVWKCQNPNANQNQADLVSKLMAVNPQINSPDLPLIAGDQICVAV